MEILSLIKKCYAKDELKKHMEMVGEISFIIAKAMALPDKACHKIYLAGKLHDLGKVAIPDDILQKTDLTDDELAIIRLHPVIGAEMIKSCQNALVTAIIREAILHHHEFFNGNGYPLGLVGKTIPLCARIVAVADVFAALTNDRPYRKAWNKDQAVDFIAQQRGKQFDPEVVNAFLKCIHGQA